MIIKVPVYVDIDAIKSEDIQPIVEDLSNHFYSFLRKENLNKQIKESHLWDVDEVIPKAKLISRAKALEHLRKGIK